MMTNAEKALISGGLSPIMTVYAIILRSSLIAYISAAIITVLSILITSYYYRQSLNNKEGYNWAAITGIILSVLPFVALALFIIILFLSVPKGASW